MRKRPPPHASEPPRPTAGLLAAIDALSGALALLRREIEAAPLQTPRSVPAPAWIDDLTASLPPMLSLAELADLLRVHERTLHRMLRDGRLRSIRHAPLPGARHLIPRAEVMRYLRERAPR